MAYALILASADQAASLEIFTDLDRALHVAVERHGVVEVGCVINFPSKAAILTTLARGEAALLATNDDLFDSFTLTLAPLPAESL
tara:strand:+ start:118 stop:372 length:255 start_codon:yes stop_codon:yes gene_type:complete